jgi:hypothetical protein
MAAAAGPVVMAARAELKGLPVVLRASTLAMAVLELARRLDEESTSDREVTALVRELRLSLAELHRQAGTGLGNEMEGWLASISSPSFGD